MVNFYDVPAIRARLAASDLPVPVCKKYLTLLESLNALSILMAPVVEAEADEPGSEALERILNSQLARRQALEEEYPELVVASRPTGWTGN